MIMKYINLKFSGLWVTLVGVLGFSSFFSSCNDDVVYEKMKAESILTEIVFNVTNPLPLLVGTDSLISYTSLPDYATKTDLIWETADKSIATVDESGRIFAHKVGKVDITARSVAGFVAVSTLHVEVVNEIIKVEDISITSATGDMFLYITSTLALNAVVTPNTVTYFNVKWTSDTPDIATVSDKGEVTGIKEGTATIRATATDGSNVTATAQIVVKPTIAVEDIIVAEEDCYLAKGETSKLTITVVPENATLSALEWSSADKTIVEFADDGVFTAKKYGETELTVRMGSFEKKIPVTVIEGKINDTFTYNDGGWGSYIGTKSKYPAFDINEGKLIVPSLSNLAIEKTKIGLHPGNYPILAVKVKKLVGGVSSKYVLDIWRSPKDSEGSDGTEQRAGKYGSTDNTMETIDCGDGYVIYYGDISENGPGFKDIAGKGLPNKFRTYNSLQYVFSVEEGDDYEVDWVKTFRSVESLDAFAESEKAANE